MEGDAGRDLEVQGSLDGRVNAPSCCLKARAFPIHSELEANCHVTFVSGWFSDKGGKSM